MFQKKYLKHSTVLYCTEGMLNYLDVFNKTCRFIGIIKFDTYVTL